METFLIVVHLIVVIFLAVCILLQRSEGGGLGIGGGSSRFMTGRGQADFLSRLTTICGVLFFATSALLSIFAFSDRNSDSLIETLAPGATSQPLKAGEEPAAKGTSDAQDNAKAKKPFDSILDQLAPEDPEPSSNPAP